MHPIADLDAVPSRRAKDTASELAQLDRAVEAVRNDIRGLIASLQTSLPREGLALFDAYLHMLDDGALPGDIREGRSAGRVGPRCPAQGDPAAYPSL